MVQHSNERHRPRRLALPAWGRWPAIVLFSTLAVALAVFGGVGSPWRPLVVFWFLLVCPGMALVGLFLPRDGVATVTLALALSIALDTLIAMALLYAGYWSPRAGLVVLIAITLVGVVLQFRGTQARLGTFWRRR